MTPVRVLHVFGRLDRGGAESRTMDIYRNIDRSKVQFDFIVHTGEKCAFDDEVVELGAHIYHLPRFNGLNIFSYRRAWRSFLKAHTEYKIIHIHILNVAPVFVSLLKDIPVRIAHARSASARSFSRKAMIMLFRGITTACSTQLLAVSKEASKFMFGRRQAIVVPNAINATMYTYDEKVREQVRKEMGLEKSFVLGHVGRFTAEKNHAFLLSVLDILRQKVYNVKMLFVGEGLLKRGIEEDAFAMGLDIIFAGSRNDVPRLMQAMDALVLPSLFEGMPGVAIEAQAAGLPCLLSDKITPNVKIVDHLVEFLPVYLGAPAWVESILRIVESRYQRVDTLEAIKAAKYDIAGIAQWYENFYSDLDEKSEV